MTLDTVTKIIHLRTAKTPQHTIARQIGVCTRTILRVLKKHAFEFALREIEVMEAIFEKSGITHQSQVLAQASHLKQLEVALANSSINDPNFERLARMTQKARKLYFDFMDRATPNWTSPSRRPPKKSISMSLSPITTTNLMESPNPTINHRSNR